MENLTTGLAVGAACFAAGMALALLVRAVAHLGRIAEIMAMCHAAEIDAFHAARKAEAEEPAPAASWDGTDAPPGVLYPKGYFGSG